MEKTVQSRASELGSGKINSLIVKFAVPSIISMLIGSVYNIADQIFIGKGVNELALGVTTVSFPLTTLCAAVSLAIGVGGAAGFNLSMGRKNEEKAASIFGNAIFWLAVGGFLVSCLTYALMPFGLPEWLGATKDNLPYANTYFYITGAGFPFLVFSTGASHLIRADGSATYAMLCNLAGAILNIGLNALLIFVIPLGVAGAAIATVIGQITSCALAVYYMKRKIKTVRISKEHIKPDFKKLVEIVSLGAASCFNQLAIMVVQISLNNSLTYYGALSHYGADIPLTCAGVVSRLSFISGGIIVGVAQGCQPIISYNYGAENYSRVKGTYKRAAAIASLISICAFVVFQLFPRQLASIFLPADANEAYYEFTEKYMRVFFFTILVNGIQPVTANFLSSIGRAKLGFILSLTRQIIFFLPCLFILPRFFGIDGIMYTGPIADTVAFICAILLVINEMKRMTKLEKSKAAVAL